MKDRTFETKKYWTDIEVQAVDMSINKFEIRCFSLSTIEDNTS
jgi:hypothetical protein